MMSEEAYPEAAAILRDAGWKPHDPWGVYTRGTLVMGFSPDGQHFDVKNWGADVHGEDYPDDPVEAAQWLVRLRANPLTTEATLEAPVWAIEEAFDPQPEQVETQGHESDGETGEDDGPQGEAVDSISNASTPRDEDGGDDAGWDVLGGEVIRPTESGGDGAVDADFTIEDLGGPDEALSLEAPPPEDFAFEEIAAEADASGAFIFGDNLHQMRTAAIGLVVQAAIERLPAGIDYARLAELRNFVMGVSEGRWADDTAKRDELDTLEATERKRRGVEAVRDEKVAFLVGASREEIEDFAVDAGWPE